MPKSIAYLQILRTAQDANEVPPLDVQLVESARLQMPHPVVDQHILRHALVGKRDLIRSMPICDSKIDLGFGGNPILGGNLIFGGNLISPKYIFNQNRF